MMVLQENSLSSNNFFDVPTLTDLYLSWESFAWNGTYTIRGLSLNLKTTH